MKFAIVGKGKNRIIRVSSEIPELNIPSDGSVLVSQVLYETTGEEKYLDIIMRNIAKSPADISYVASLAYRRP